MFLNFKFFVGPGGAIGVLSYSPPPGGGGGGGFLSLYVSCSPESESKSDSESSSAHFMFRTMSHHNWVRYCIILSHHNWVKYCNMLSHHLCPTLVLPHLSKCQLMTHHYYDLDSVCWVFPWQERRGHNFCFSKSQECHWQDWYILTNKFGNGL